MAKSLEIPQDIINSVIAAVGEDTLLLKQCALVSSSFLLPSRKQLFSRITLRNDKTCRGIHQLLVQNPIIQSSVRSINLYMDWDLSGFTLINGTSLPAFLRLPFCCLERFYIDLSRAAQSLDWNSFSSELKDALSNIIHSFNLKILSFRGITNVPTTFFLHIVHLTTLELYGVSPIDSGYEISSPLIRVSNGVAPKTSHVVVDRLIWRLKSVDKRTIFPFISLFLTNSEHKVTRSIFLPFMCRLRFFEIFLYLEHDFFTTDDFGILSFLMRSLSISLTSPATLEHLEFNITLYDNDNYFDEESFYESLRDAEVWSHLESIATHPTGSRLQRVDINIKYSFRCDDNGDEPSEDEVMKAVLDGLPLLRTKDILFVKAVVSR